MNKYNKLLAIFFFIFNCIYFVYLKKYIDHIPKKQLHLRIFNKTEEEHVFIIIISGRYNFKKRQDVREMLNVGEYAKFMIGNRPCRVPPESRHSSVYYCFGGRETIEYNGELEKLEKQVKDEIEKYNDIVELDMIDYYRALPRKLKLSYKWGVENFPNAKWFFKTDDDCYFNYDNIQNFFKKKTDTDVPVLYGEFRKNSKVHRSGKWEEHNYKKERYPPFPKGSGHCINRPFASYIAENFENMFEFQGEDVSLGIWAEETVEPKPKLVSISEVLPDGMKRCKQLVNMALACGHDMGKEQYYQINS